VKFIYRVANFLVLLLSLVSPHARADEIRVLCAGAAKMALEAISPEFSRLTGHTLRASFDTVGAQRDRVLQGAPGTVADVVILSTAAISQLAKAGHLPAGEGIAIGVVSVSLAVPLGTPVPAISTPAQLKQVLTTASSIAYADPQRGATAGTHFDKVLREMGLYDTLRERLVVRPFGVDVIKDVSEGKYAIGVSQSSEILQHANIAMVGPLPAPYALITPYTAAVTSTQPAAKQLMDFLAGPAAMTSFRATGFLHP
jgi:molybdate transport system substrate-binding protein